MSKKPNETSNPSKEEGTTAAPHITQQKQPQQPQQHHDVSFSMPPQSATPSAATTPNPQALNNHTSDKQQPKQSSQFAAVTPQKEDHSPSEQQTTTKDHSPNISPTTQATDIQQKNQAKQSVFGFFVQAPGKIEEKAKGSMSSLISSIQNRKAAATKHKQIDPNSNNDETSEKNPQQQPHPQQQQPQQPQRVKSSTHLNNQDFGNISEIVDMKAHVAHNIGDDTAQEEDDEEFKSLLNNNNNNNTSAQTLQQIQQHRKQSQKPPKRADVENVFEAQEHDEQQDEGNIQATSNRNHHKHNHLNSSSSNRQKQSNMHSPKDDRLLTESMVNPQNESQATIPSPQKQKLIDDAKKKKKELEIMLRQLNSEISDLQQNPTNKQDKQESKNANNNNNNQQPNNSSVSPPPSNLSKFLKIQEDKDAQLKALQLVKKMNIARKEKQEKQQQLLQMQAKELSEAAQENLENNRAIKQQQHERMSSVKQVRIQEIEQRRKDRIIVNREQNRVIKDLVSGVSDPREKYHQEVELPELERRKQLLAEKRQLYKPMDIQEIKEHALKHDEEIRMRKMQSKAKQIVDYDDGAGVLAGIPKKSAMLNKVLEEDKELKAKAAAEMKKKREQIERRNEYAKLVKEVHVPKLRDVELEQQLEYERKEAEKQARKNERNRWGGVRKVNVESNTNNLPANNSKSLKGFKTTASSAGVPHRGSNPGTIEHHFNPRHDDYQPEYDVNDDDESNHQNERDSSVAGQTDYFSENLQNNNQKIKEHSKPPVVIKKKKIPMNNNNGSSNARLNLPDQNNNNNNDYFEADVSSNQKTEENAFQQEKLQNQENVSQNGEQAAMRWSVKSIRKEKFSKYEDFRGNSLQRGSQNDLQSSTVPVQSLLPMRQKPVHTDYISELRKKREANEKKTGAKPAKLDDWEKYRYDPNLSQKEKYSYILQSAARIEHTAKLKEMKNRNDIDGQEEANNLYIDAIKAKLSLLDNLA